MYLGLASLTIGALTFTLNHYLWDYFSGPLPGYQILLYPANLSLVYFWHPLFTEEVDFWPKLLMLLIGQYTLVTAISYVILNLIKFVNGMIKREEI